ncbi:MAG: LON peptidase substrate-binding domain-containing protein [Acidobacteriota bacterium]|nr:LON peptidase substrate-binding domain-containing protein [Acidobacteriota bacterium]MDH3528333.1 LON peptidase substrate-binding domain-containing protein [Acidobacteriota bacterium]
MSEESDKILGIDRLPIFPLPLVLLPHEILPLHIFEPKYRDLLSDVSVSKNLFGVSLFEPESEFDDRPKVGSCGCVAELREKETLDDGRSNILTVGIIRYRVTEFVETDADYLTAKLDFFEDQAEDPSQTEKLADEVFELFKRVAKAAHKMSGRRGDFPEIPKAPAEQLSFLVSASFNLPTADKYELLEMVSTIKRLERVRSILLDSVKRVEESAMIDQISRTNGHANKKIDLGS